MNYFDPITEHTHDGINSPLIDKKANGIGGIGGSGSTYARMSAGSQSIGNFTDTLINLDFVQEATGITADTTVKGFTIITSGTYFISGQITFDSPQDGKLY